MAYNKISVIIPAFNEKRTLPRIISAVQDAELPLEKEIVIIDDGSNDGTREILEQYQNSCKIIFHGKNQGKGTAIRRGFKEATGDIIIIQDADLEYDPHEYRLLIGPILAGDADVVYGSRFITPFPRRILYFSHYIANKLVTFISNMLTGLNLSDMETGYKVFTRDAINKILPNLKAKRFGIEPELTAQVAQHNLRIYEVGISYKGRTYHEGKKINWKDGLAAIWHIIRFNIFR